VNARSRSCGTPRPENRNLLRIKIRDGRTTVPVHFEPWGTVFVVFRKPAKAASRTLPKAVETQLAIVDGPWRVKLPTGPGRAGIRHAGQNLYRWSDSQDKGVKYFSGTGTYAKTIQASADWFKPGAQLWIDLGEVKNLAEVAVEREGAGDRLHALIGWT